MKINLLPICYIFGAFCYPGTPSYKNSLPLKIRKNIVKIKCLMFNYQNVEKYHDCVCPSHLKVASGPIWYIFRVFCYPGTLH